MSCREMRGLRNCRAESQGQGVGLGHPLGWGKEHPLEEGKGYKGY